MAPDEGPFLKKSNAYVQIAVKVTKSLLHSNKYYMNDQYYRQHGCNGSESSGYLFCL